MSKNKQKEVSISRLKQVLFTFREVSKIAGKVNKPLVWTVFILNIVLGFSNLPVFYLEKLIIDTVIKNIGNKAVQDFILLIALLTATRLFLDFARQVLLRISRHFEYSLSEIFSAEIETLIGAKLAELDQQTLDDPEFKDRLAKIKRESMHRAWQLMRPLSDIPSSLIGFITSVAILITLHPLIAIGVVIVSLPEFLMQSKFIRLEYELSTKLAPTYKLWGWLHSYLTSNRNYLELKLLNLHHYLTLRLRTAQRYAINERLVLRKRRLLSQTWITVPFTIFELFISVWLALWVIIERITLGSFQFYIRNVHAARGYLSDFIGAILEMYEHYIYVTDLVWFLNLKPVIPNIEKSKKIKDGEHTLEFKDVWFKYKSTQKWTIKGVSFKINPKENIALIGLNGAGKSTIIKLLARFYDPQKGEILVDGINIKELNVSEWRRKLAVLFQEFEMYPFSVNESVGYGDIERLSEQKDIEEAVKLTGMYEYVENLPLKFNNPLDPEFDKGVRPSIGQMQRFGIARILFRKSASILIMDEPTSNVDPEAEEKIFKELVKDARNKILIFVTQRFSTVRLADRIFVLDRGKITEMGTHKELLKLKGTYYRLFTLQAKGYK